MLKYPNRVLVYGLEGDCPMFYDSDGRGSEIFPTGIDKPFCRTEHAFFLIFFLTCSFRMVNSIRVEYLSKFT